ncbi:MAG: hypothetical protein JNM09_09480 [Blastocatellia bacterium]|nr:hypothetical protein [Blastocatellia bacterium]
MGEATNNTPSTVFKSAIKLLTFRLGREEFLRLNYKHLAFGLICTWIVGMGRYWDDPGASLLQHLGVGSLIYILALSLLLWLIIWPLKPHAWSYRHVLTFVSLVSPPAILYAIPVERFYRLETARTMNVWFLATVAVWRVALLFFYLMRHARLNPATIILAALLPITLIIVTLTALNLERAVFDLMAGIRENGGANDEAYAVLVFLTFWSVILFVPILAGYLIAIVKVWSNSRADLSIISKNNEDDSPAPH